MNEKIGKIKLELLKEEFTKQIKDSYTLNLSMVLLEEFENLQQENARLKDKIEKAIEKIKNIDKFEERLNDDTRIYMIQDVDVDEIERILKEN